MSQKYLLTLFLFLCPLLCPAASFPVRQLTANTNGFDETWGIRNSATSGGKLLWIDGSNSVVFFNGTTTSVVQPKGTNDNVENPVFTLGSGSTPGQTIGVWRRGADGTSFVSINGGTPVLIVATNPFDPNNALNAEAVAVADGSIFMILSTGMYAPVFRVDPVSGYATNLTGSAMVPGALFGRISTSAGQAVWPFTDNPNNIIKLHFYDGSTVHVVDTNITSNPHIAQGRIVYTKLVGGMDQVFLYDSTLPSPSPVQITADATGTNRDPRTDGRHIAWLHTAPGATHADILLYGGIPLTSVASQVRIQAEHPFQLDRGQLLWQDVSNRLEYFSGSGPFPLDISPSITFGGSDGMGTPCCAPWLTDGFVAWTGLSGDGGTDREVFLLTGKPPADAQQPLPPLLLTATPGTNQVILTWDRVIGATSYNLYVAYDPAVSRDNFHSLLGGQQFTGVSSPFTLNGLTNRIYFFAISTVEGTDEGPSSPPIMTALWAPASGAPQTNYYAVAAGLTNGAIAYASGGRAVYKTTNGGAAWNALAGGIQGLDVRALAVDGPKVYAATRDIFGAGPARILRSHDGGSSWADAVSDGGELGEQNKVLAIDPVTPSRIYAADFRLPTMNEPNDSFVIRSSDSGTNWTHLPEPMSPEGAEIRAYALAIDPINPSILYAGGGGTPNLARSTNAGSTWADISPGPGFVNALAIDSAHPQTIYAGLVHFTQVSRGFLRSTNSGLTWGEKNTGFPTPLPRINTLLVDPLNHQQIHAGTDVGYFITLDGGWHWMAANFGLDSADARYISALALTGSRQLLAATAKGVYRLDLSALNLTLPALMIVRSGATATLSWPASAESFLLESTGNLNMPVSWTVVTNSPAINNEQKQLSVGLTNAARFYRLRRP